MTCGKRYLRGSMAATRSGLGGTVRASSYPGGGEPSAADQESGPEGDAEEDAQHRLDGHPPQRFVDGLAGADEGVLHLEGDDLARVDVAEREEVNHGGGPGAQPVFRLVEVSLQLRLVDLGDVD